MFCTTKIDNGNRPPQVSEWKLNSYSPNSNDLTFLYIIFFFPGDSVDNGDTPPQMHSIFSIEFYQRFFNVDTNIVSDRIQSAIIPRRAPVNYLKQNIGSNPDLYGPFWIVVTLVNVLMHFIDLTLIICATSSISGIFHCHQRQYRKLFARDFK